MQNLFFYPLNSPPNVSPEETKKTLNNRFIYTVCHRGFSEKVDNYYFIPTIISSFLHIGNISNKFI